MPGTKLLFLLIGNACSFFSLALCCNPLHIFDDTHKSLELLDSWPFVLQVIPELLNQRIFSVFLLHSCIILLSGRPESSVRVFVSCHLNSCI